MGTFSKLNQIQLTQIRLLFSGSTHFRWDGCVTFRLKVSRKVDDRFSILVFAQRIATCQESSGVHTVLPSDTNEYNNDGPMMTYLDVTKIWIHQFQQNKDEINCSMTRLETKSTN